MLVRIEFVEVGLQVSKLNTMGKILVCKQWKCCILLYCICLYLADWSPFIRSSFTKWKWHLAFILGNLFCESKVLFPHKMNLKTLFWDKNYFVTRCAASFTIKNRTTCFNRVEAIYKRLCSINGNILCEMLNIWRPLSQRRTIEFRHCTSSFALEFQSLKDTSQVLWAPVINFL